MVIGTPTTHLSRSPIAIGALVTSCTVSALLAPFIVWVGDFASTDLWPAVLTYLLVAMVGGFLGILSVWDSLTRRIPDRVLIAFCVALAPVAMALTLVTQNWGMLALSALIAFAWFVFALGYTVYRPEAFGGGDLKAMPLVMLPLGLLSLWVPILWIAASLISASIHSIKNRIKGDKAVPFAPSMNVALPLALGITALVQGSAGIIPG